MLKNCMEFIAKYKDFYPQWVSFGKVFLFIKTRFYAECLDLLNTVARYNTTGIQGIFNHLAPALQVKSSTYFILF